MSITAGTTTCIAAGIAGQLGLDRTNIGDGACKLALFAFTAVIIRNLTRAGPSRDLSRRLAGEIAARGAVGRGGRLDDRRPEESGPVTPGGDERPGPVPESAVSADAVIVELRPRAADGGALVDVVAAAYDAFERALYAFALGLTRSGTAAEDLVQESYLRLVREVQAGRPPDNVKAWLYRVCANLATSRGRRATVATRYLPFLASREVGETPEARHLRLELGAELSAALAELTHDERTGLLLSAGGFHGPEIADVIGRSHGATRTMLTRARTKVQARLSGEVDRRA